MILESITAVTNFLFFFTYEMVLIKKFACNHFRPDGTRVLDHVHLQAGGCVLLSNLGWRWLCS